MTSENAAVAAATEQAGMDTVDGEAYCWLIYFSHHEDGSLSCSAASCPHCAAMAAADALLRRSHV